MRPKAHIRTAALAASVLIATARVGFALACGDTITTKETLTANLDCMTEPGLTIEEGGSLDLNAFKVTCNGTQVGIRLNADKTSVSNGSVGNCQFAAIELNGSGHKVNGVYIFGSDIGIRSPNTSSTGIKINNVSVIATTYGLELEGSEYSISAASISAGDTGAYIDGLGGNKIKDVTVIDATEGVSSFDQGGNKLSNVRIGDSSTGLDISSPNNKVANVHVANFDLDGIRLDQSANKLAASTFIGSSGGDPYSIYVRTGEGNSVSKCATLGGWRGITTNVAPTANTVSNNRLFGGLQYGIIMGTTDAEISGNVALGNGTIDLEDDSFGCTNVWTKNVGKRSDACIN